jgi:hypothetical protein
MEILPPVAAAGLAATASIEHTSHLAYGLHDSLAGPGARAAAHRLPADAEFAAEVDFPARTRRLRRSAPLEPMPPGRAFLRSCLADSAAPSLLDRAR